MVVGFVRLNYVTPHASEDDTHLSSYRTHQHWTTFDWNTNLAMHPSLPILLWHLPELD